MGRKKKTATAKMGSFGWALLRITAKTMVKTPKKGRGYRDKYRTS